MESPETPAAPPPEGSFWLWLRVSQVYLTETGSAELTGVGLNLRMGPPTSHAMRWFGMQVWLDVSTGHDKYATRRTEAACGFDFVFYLNPRDAVQLFAFVGGGWAVVGRSERWTDERTQDNHSQIGLGVELPLVQRLAIDVNAVAFYRSMTNRDGTKQNTDGGREPIPYYSNGVILRAGIGFSL